MIVYLFIKIIRRKGIAIAILESSTDAAISTHASITAKTFFEKRGYMVIKEQIVDRQGITLINYVIERQTCVI
ncbi:hypothetical protein [Enterococcus xiangfangensis]|uniref:hypothetical protein n=1 Tax=Enterococcus xiangfangensis TaxID=1296537 RepID=UPI003D16F3E0